LRVACWLLLLAGPRHPSSEWFIHTAVILVLTHTHDTANTHVDTAHAHSNTRRAANFRSALKPSWYMRRSGVQPSPNPGAHAPACGAIRECAAPGLPCAQRSASRRHRCSVPRMHEPRPPRRTPGISAPLTRPPGTICRVSVGFGPPKPSANPHFRPQSSPPPRTAPCTQPAPGVAQMASRAAAPHQPVKPTPQSHQPRRALTPSRAWRSARRAS